jgi:hypothetical protein
MPKTREAVLSEALELAPEERADVAFELLQSLDSLPAPELTDEGWIAEIERRARAALAGEPGILWPEARRRVEERLQRR